MPNFNINVSISTFKDIHMTMEPGKDVMTVAKALSVQFKDCYVSVSMFARLRRGYENGEITTSEPDLGKFYEDVDPQDAHDWACCGQVTD